MKKFLIFSFLMLGILCFSQSVTKKYNTLNQRYEYFNSNGSMIGYEKYNSLYKRWEYFDIQQNSQSNSTPNRQPYQYRDPGKVDLGIDILNSQSGNNQNNAQVIINDIVSQIKSMDISEERKTQILNAFYKTVEINSRRISRDPYWLYEITNLIISY